jgi:CheY-like chemotaxis protein
MTTETPTFSVLLVDDEPAIHRTVTRLLKAAGFTVLAVPSGQECLRLLREGFHGLILMDIMMPDLDGWDTIRAIKDAGLLPGNLICMLTALVEPGSGKDDLAPLVFDYLPKPFDRQQLLNIVEMALNHLGT